MRRVSSMSSGAALATAGLGALVFGLIEGPARGWGDPLVLASIAGGVLGLAAFLFAEMRVSSPMMPLGLFRSATFAGANLLTLLLYGAFGGALFWLPFNLIQVQGYAPTAAGAALLPAILILFALSRWTGGLIGRYGPKLPLTIGPSIVALAFLLFARIGTEGRLLDHLLSGGGGTGDRDGYHRAAADHRGDDRRPRAASRDGVWYQQRGRTHRGSDRYCGLRGAGDDDLHATARGRLDAIPDLPPAVREAVEAQRGELAAAQPPTDAGPEIGVAVERAIDSAFVAGFRVAMLVGAGMALFGAVLSWRLVEGKASLAGPPTTATQS